MRKQLLQFDNYQQFTRDEETSIRQKKGLKDIQGQETSKADFYPNTSIIKGGVPPVKTVLIASLIKQQTTCREQGT